MYYGNGDQSCGSFINLINYEALIERKIPSVK